MSATHELSRTERTAIIEARRERQHRRDAERAAEALRPVDREHAFRCARTAHVAARIDAAARKRIGRAERGYLSTRACAVDHVRLDAALAERGNDLDAQKAWRDCGFWYPVIERKALRNRTTNETNASVTERIEALAGALGLVTVGSYRNEEYEAARDVARIQGTFAMRSYWVKLRKYVKKVTPSYVASRDQVGRFVLRPCMLTGVGTPWQKPAAPRLRPSVWSREVFFASMRSAVEADVFAEAFARRLISDRMPTVVWHDSCGQEQHASA